MKKLLTPIILLVSTLLFSSCLTEKEPTINKATAYEAKVLSKGESLYILQNGENKKIYTRKDPLNHERKDLAFKTDDINFDGLADISVIDLQGYGGVNYFYKMFLAQNGIYKESKLTLSNYILYPRYKTILSEYKSGPRHFTDLYTVNNRNKIYPFVKYENYREDDLCFINAKNPNPKYNAVVSCEKLIKEHKAVKLFGKVIKQKAWLYNHDTGQKLTGMYLIKGDIVELIGGKAESNKVLIHYKGNRTIRKYIKVEDLDVSKI